MNYRIVPLILSIVLFIFCVSGCWGIPPETSAEPSIEVTEPAEESAGEQVQEEVKDYNYAYEKYMPDEIVMTINGFPVMWDEYFYWIYGTVVQLEEYFGEIKDWDSASPVDESRSIRQLVEDEAMANLRSMRAVESKAAELGVEIDGEDQAMFDADWELEVEYFGSEEAIEEYLKSFYMNIGIYQKIRQLNRLYLKCFNEIYGENGSLCSDEETMEYVEAAGIIGTKHILLLTVDENGETLPDVEKEEKRVRMEDFLKQLDESQEVEALFDQLMNENSEDPGLASSPNGYFFSDSDEIYSEYRQAMNALQLGEYSAIVESTSGYHIILRIEVTPDSVIGYNEDGSGETMRYAASMNNFDVIVDGWANEAVVEYSDKFKDMKLEDIF